MKKPAFLILAMFTLALLAAGCGGDDGGSKGVTLQIGVGDQSLNAVSGATIQYRDPDGTQKNAKTNANGIASIYITQTGSTMIDAIVYQGNAYTHSSYPDGIPMTLEGGLPGGTIPLPIQINTATGEIIGINSFKITELSGGSSDNPSSDNRVIRVKDHNGAMVSGATISYQESDGTSKTVMTNASGSASITVTQPGNITVISISTPSGSYSASISLYQKEFTLQIQADGKVSLVF
ncbi:carboxypeptidase-like regulatory domain-containing protein [Acetonema longum]|uniref:Big-1 domain-containing protein n=1 Tax=Acetonema longum DSM 6540 TaxID=1009370 RepID=F7NII5_9FIRM|nr:carboxypeptidase-like regulatory domain-containing protein [Acetonema longum]EGO64131.1 hypothetical protein ALO_09439 [Acetonema longum DSM 6540]